MISSQSPQIAAFIYSKLTKSQQKQVIPHLSSETQETIKSIKVETIPLAGKVFQDLLSSVLSPLTITVSEEEVSEEEVSEEEVPA